MEEKYLLVVNCHLDLSVIETMPIPVRRWWMQRSMKDIEKKNNPQPKNSGPAPWNRGNSGAPK